MSRSQILVLSGSTRQPSLTRVLARNVADALEALGADVSVWDASEPALPIADPAFHKTASEHPHADVRQLDSVAQAADGFVLASPIYHNSYSGVLKNVLDHLNIPHFFNKPVGLISHGGDRSTQAVDHMRIVVRGLNGVATPTHVCTRAEDFELAQGGTFELTALDIRKRIERFADELVQFSLMLGVMRQARLG